MKYITTCIAFVLIISLASAQTKKDSLAVPGIFSTGRIGFFLEPTTTSNLGNKYPVSLNDYVKYEGTTENQGSGFSVGFSYESKDIFKNAFISSGLVFQSFNYSGRTNGFYSNNSYYTFGYRVKQYCISTPFELHYSVLKTVKGRLDVSLGAAPVIYPQMMFGLNLYSYPNYAPQITDPFNGVGFQGLAGISYEQVLGRNMLFKMQPYYNLDLTTSLHGRRLQAVGINFCLYTADFLGSRCNYKDSHFSDSIADLFHKGRLGISFSYAPGFDLNTYVFNAHNYYNGFRTGKIKEAPDFGYSLGFEYETKEFSKWFITTGLKCREINYYAIGGYSNFDTYFVDVPLVFSYIIFQKSSGGMYVSAGGSLDYAVAQMEGKVDATDVLPALNPFLYAGFGYEHYLGYSDIVKIEPFFSFCANTTPDERRPASAGIDLTLFPFGKRIHKDGNVVIANDSVKAATGNVFKHRHIGLFFTPSLAADVGNKVAPDIVDYSEAWYPTSFYYTDIKETPGFSFSAGLEYETSNLGNSRLFLSLGLEAGRFYYTGATTILDTEYQYNIVNNNYTKIGAGMGREKYNYKATFVGMPLKVNYAILESPKQRFYVFVGVKVLNFISQTASPSYDTPDSYAGLAVPFCSCGLGYEHSINNSSLFKLSPELNISPGATVHNRRLASAGISLGLLFGR